jgi:RNA polymerase sigma-70 factor (TIGR02957 family)
MKLVHREEPDTYQQLRPLLFSISYRMLGSVSEAEDVVQEALLRVHLARERDEIVSVEAYASTVVTRLSIDTLRSARLRREEYVGPWVPEPLVGEPAPDVADHAETADSLSLAFLVLLESLSPLERAAFLLREVFDYPYQEIGDILSRSPSSCRKLVARARAHVNDRKPRFEASRQARDELATRFLAACRQGDLDALVGLLAADVVFTGDGGGKVPPGAAISRPVCGRESVGRLLLGLARREVDVHFEPAPVNGQAGAVLLDSAGRIVSVLSLDIADGQVQAIRSVINPEKLQHLGELADLDDLLRRR